MFVIAAPDYVEILLEDGKTSAAIRNVSRIGPFNEGTIVTLLCRSGGGRPVPRIEWWNGSHIMEGKVFLVVLSMFCSSRIPRFIFKAI